MSWLGLDVGGANLKAADGLGWARTVGFPLWREPSELASAIEAMLESAPPAERIAVTMTGELCDCFRTKAEGVRHIVSAVEQAAAPRKVFVCLVEGRLVSPDEARASPILAAASNWHALAQFACRFLDGGGGLLVDVGSTTTDIVPLVDGQPAPSASTDTERSIAGELVYAGVERTPVCAIVRSLPWRGAQCPIAAELFATTADVYVTLGMIAEDPDATWTADGRGLTQGFARDRLARMICADRTTFDDQDARRASETVRAAQVNQLIGALEKAIARMAERPRCVVLSGGGEFLAAEVIATGLAPRRLVSLSGELGPEVSRAAPAHALAVLAREAKVGTDGR